VLLKSDLDVQQTYLRPQISRAGLAVGLPPDLVPDCDHQWDRNVTNILQVKLLHWPQTKIEKGFFLNFGSML
jgi:hypothetical protein